MARHPVHTHGIPDEATLTTVLTAAGYTNITGASHHGASWHCSATDSTGAVVPLVIDSHGGIHLDDKAG